MNCPHCNAPNEAGSRFCISCGQALTGGGGTAATPPTSPLAQTAAGLLGILTARLALGLLLLFFVLRVLTGLSFLENLRVPEINLTGDAMLTIVAYVIALVLLLIYAQTMRSLWGRAFPRLAPLTAMLVALIYVLCLSAAFRALVPLFRLFTEDADVFLIVRIVLSVLAILLLGAAWLNLYRGLPAMLSRLQISVAINAGDEVACLNCGHLNRGEHDFCSQCGTSLGAKPAEAA